MSGKNQEDEATPNADDVASLYSWANLHGTKYRDFSTARQELRTQSKNRATQEPGKQAAVDAAAGEEPSVPTGPIVGAPIAGAPGGVERRGTGRPVGSAPAPQLPPLYDRRISKPSQAPKPAGSFLLERRDLSQRAAPERSSEQSPDRATEPLSVPSPQQTESSAEPPSGQPAAAITAPVLPHSPSNFLHQGNRAEAASLPASLSLARDEEFQGAPARPAWLASDPESAVYGQVAGADTLQQSRERVASRWFALQGVFDGASEPVPDTAAVRIHAHVPTLAVFSLAGGVGKTSLVATLGRELAALGERVLLVDTTSYGLLPFYFGARELRSGVMRTFASPGGNAPIHMLNVDSERQRSSSEEPDWLAAELTRNSGGANRILVDLATAAVSVTRRILRMGPTVLVPVIPDMNSVVSLGAVDSFFRNQQEADLPAGHSSPIRPYYVLNQFDGSLPLHLDVREVLRQQLGDRLLPFVLRRSQAVSEALAEGMTVVDYAPGSPVAADFLNLSNWLRGVSMPASAGFRGVRWSEQ